MARSLKILFFLAFCVYSIESFAFDPPVDRLRRTPVHTIPRLGLNLVQGQGMCREQVLRQLGDGVNIPFYEEYVTYPIFEKRAKESGLLQGQDLDQIMPVLDRILKWRERDPWPALFTRYRAYEVGAGFGRVLDYFRDVNIPIDWLAYEQTPKFAQMLRDKFFFHRNIEVYTESFLKTRVRKKAHVIFMLWGTLVEFTPKEQERMLAKARSLLVKGGVLVTDLPVDLNHCGPEHVTYDNDRPDGHQLEYRPEVDSPYVWQGFLPYPGTLIKMAEARGLVQVHGMRWIPFPFTPTSRSIQFFMRKDEVPPHLNLADLEILR